MAEVEYCPHGYPAAECAECREQAFSVAEDGLAAIRDAMDHLEALVEQALNDYAKEALIGPMIPAALLDGIEVQRVRLQALEREIANKVRFNLGDQPVLMPTGRHMLLRASKNRRGWDHAAARRDLMTATFDAMVDKETGEAPTPEEFAGRVLDAASIGGWKVGAFREVGLSVDDYCSFDYGDFKPQFQGDADE